MTVFYQDKIVGKVKPGYLQMFILLTLIIAGAGLFGCRSEDRPPALQATLAAVSTDMKIQLTATVTTQLMATPTATVVPTRSPSPPKPPPTLNLTPTFEPDLRPIDLVLVCHGDRSLPYIALTFDTCQSVDFPTGYDETIVNILIETETPATLFLGGLWMQRYPTQTQALAANPLFELGNHAWSHPDFSQLKPEEMRVEILRTQETMAKLTGQQPTLFRFPFGVYTAEALAVAGQHRLRAIQWDVVTGDPDPRISARAIVDAVAAQAENGSIVVMHMNSRGWRTAEALPAIIKQLRHKGYTLVTVSQLLGLAPLPPAEPIRN